jgi:predicted dehydrogenase
MSRRRAALLGFGHVAEHGHLPAWRARDDFAIAAVADPDPARRAVAQRLLPDARVYADPIAALSEVALDVVDIATPPALHTPLVIRAAQAGCHVLCEKPLTTTLADYRAAVAAVRAAGVTLFTVHNWKHSGQYEQLAALLATGAIGRPTDLRLKTVWAGRAARAERLVLHVQAGRLGVDLGGRRIIKKKKAKANKNEK